MIGRFGSIRNDNLFDFGNQSVKFLEMRTDGFSSVNALYNILASNYFEYIGNWTMNRKDPDYAVFLTWSKNIKRDVDEKLWKEDLGWYTNFLAPDDYESTIWSYIMFDALDTKVISDKQKQRIAEHLKDGEFLSKTGLFSISLIDEIHWDLEDVDWGGGGQYSGHPARVIEYLFRNKIRTDAAYEILKRISQWRSVAPYISQEQFGQYFGTPHVEMPMSIAGAAYAQAVIFGVFGLNPRLDGKLEINPSYDPVMGTTSRLTNFTFQNHSYDIYLSLGFYEAFRDGKFIARNEYGTPIIF